MKAEIKALYSLDINDLDNYSPDEPDFFGFSLRLIAGPEGETGEESFDMRVCTPKWLLRRCRPEEVIVGRHFVIVFEYNFERIRNTIETFVASCTGETWGEIANKIARLGYWEFEDYRDLPG